MRYGTIPYLPCPRHKRVSRADSQIRVKTGFSEWIPAFAVKTKGCRRPDLYLHKIACDRAPNSSASHR